MLILERDIHFLSVAETTMLISSITDVKHKSIILLMLDAGLRVSECITLRFNNFDFKNKLLSVISLKKRNKITQIRQVPISKRLFLTLAEYIKTLKNINPSTYIFPSPNDPEKHLTRDAVNKYLKRLSNKININNLHPHTLRHSFATNLICNDIPLHEVADLLGHEKLDTTRIYTHIPSERLRHSMQRASEKNNVLVRLFHKLINHQEPVIYIPNDSAKYIVGRAALLQQITTHIQKGTNICLLGPIGVGKRTILDALATDKKILTFDDTAGIKKSLIYMLLYLYKNDKQAVAQIMFEDFDVNKIETQLSRQSTAYLCREIKKLVAKKEYILKIKTIDTITPSAIKVFEELKDTFTIITAATKVPLDKSHFLWNFEKIEVQNLERKYTFELIHKLSYDLQITEYELYRNHILEQTDGNPRAITEMIERYRREPVLISETIRAVTHRGPIREIDFSFIVILFIASLAIFRYMTAELDNPGLRAVGGAAMILLLFSRTYFNRTKRSNL